MSRLEKMDFHQQHQRILNELTAGEKAQAANLAGRARVCCRRAAALAIDCYCMAHQLPIPAGSALDKIAALRHSPEPLKGIHETLDHLLLRVTPQFQLPGEINLLQETRELVKFLTHEQE